MSELKINPTPQQVVMLCSGETIELNGKKISLTVVEAEPESDYSHLVNKWVRVPERLDERWDKSIQDNSWHQVDKFTKFENQDRIWFDGFYLLKEHLDLNNPLDYNPTDLIGKYIKGVKLESIYYADGKPCFHTDLGSVDFICSCVNPSEVTDTPPTKSLYYDSIFERAAFELTNEMCVQSLCPETFELWEKVKNELIVTRGMFNIKDTTSHE